MSLLKEFEEKFAELKKELKFKSSLEEIDSIFFVRDLILDRKYLSPKLGRQICSRMVDLFMGWYNYLHSLVVPNPGYIVSITESHEFDEQEKAEIMQIMCKFMEISSMNGLNGLTKNKKAEAQFIDKAVDTWNEVRPKLTSILTKVNDMWKEKAKAPPKVKKPEAHYG